MTCKHEEMYWNAAPANEQGWRCACGYQPGEPPGFSPHLDRQLVEVKVAAILFDMHEAQIVYVANGAEGDYIVGFVSAMCRGANAYDSITIAFFLLQTICSPPSRRLEYWRDLSQGIIDGKDPRARCSCGALATIFTADRGGARLTTCSDHPPGLGGEAGGA